MPSRRLLVALMLMVLVVLAVWTGGGWLTRYGLWRAPWVDFPSGIALRGEPQIGVAYTVELYTHCGLRDVAFDGDTWAIAGTPSDGHANPPPGFGNPFDLGTVTLTTPDTAAYHSSYGERRHLTRGGGLPGVDGCL